MDPRRFLIAGPALALAVASTCLSAAQVLASESQLLARPGSHLGTTAPIADPAIAKPSALISSLPSTDGQRAIGAANRAAMTRSRAERFTGGLQVFDYAPGRIFEVWTAPLRVTTLTLGEGESVVAIAAGDTVRWQVGETASGEAEGRRTHVLVKPMEVGLQTNLVVTTTRRAYLIHLRSGAPATFNAAVAWTADEPKSIPAPEPAQIKANTPHSIESFDAAYRIVTQGRRPDWTPTAVITDGVRTVIAFPPSVQTEAPLLFAIRADGQAEVVNYRQRKALFIVDRVIDRAELRVGSDRARVVKIERIRGSGT